MGERNRRLIKLIVNGTAKPLIARQFGLTKQQLQEFTDNYSRQIIFKTLKREYRNE